MLSKTWFNHCVKITDAMSVFGFSFAMSVSVFSVVDGRTIALTIYLAFTLALLRHIARLEHPNSYGFFSLKNAIRFIATCTVVIIGGMVVLWWLFSADFGWISTFPELLFGSLILGLVMGSGIYICLMIIRSEEAGDNLSKPYNQDIQKKTSFHQTPPYPKNQNDDDCSRGISYLTREEVLERRKH